MPTLLWIRPIGKFGSVMQIGMVIDKLHVARGKPHFQVQGRVICQGVKKIQGFDIVLVKPRRAIISL